MLKQFYLVFEDKTIDSFRIRHIQFNVHKRLRTLKYITYGRIDILFNIDAIEAVEILVDDNRIARLNCRIDESLTTELSERKTIAGIYKSTISFLNVLWEKHSWEKNDLENLLIEIDRDNYLSYGVYGKTIVSPDKKHKAAFFCEMFPDYTYYFLQFGEKGNDGVRKIMFLKGFTDPFMFFGFFSNAFWRDNEIFFLKDINNEIIYIFNVNADNYSIEYKPSFNTLEQLHDYVRAFEFDVPKREMHKLLGIPFS